MGLQENSDPGEHIMTHNKKEEGKTINRLFASISWHLFFRGNTILFSCTATHYLEVISIREKPIKL